VLETQGEEVFATERQRYMDKTVMTSAQEASTLVDAGPTPRLEGGHTVGSRDTSPHWAVPPTPVGRPRRGCGVLRTPTSTETITGCSRISFTGEERDLFVPDGGPA